MKIKIDKICADGKVEFTTEYGMAVGKWAAEWPQPTWYNAEIDIEDKLYWGGNIRIEDFGKEQIAVAENGEMILKGRLESVEGECAVIRFKNSIIMFVAEGKPFSVGSMIKITAKNISLYPY